MRRLDVLSSLPILLVALSGCQDSEISSLGPRTLDPAAPPGACDPWPGCRDEPGSGEAPNYHIEIAGDVNGAGDTDDRTTGVTARDFEIVDLGTFLQANVEDGATCFPNAGYTGNLHAEQANDGTVDLRIAFNALNNKGRDARYSFFGLGGVITSGVWPPDGVGTTVVFTQWSLAKGGGGGAAACSGGGAFSGTMTASELP